MQRSYSARKSCLETATAGLELARAPSRTTLAHEGPELETATGRWVPASLHARPATPVAGEAGGRGEGSCTAPALQPSTPGGGEACRGGEEKSSGAGGVDRPGCSTTLLSPPRLGGGGAGGRGGARVQALTAGGDDRTPWWLAAN
jgi:hypothetical protein